MANVTKRRIDKKKLFQYLEYLGIATLIRYYSAEFRSINGDIMLFLCPFHNDTRLGAAMAYINKNDFICHACGTGGPLSKLALKCASVRHGIPMENFNELLEAIASDLGIPRESIVSDGEWNGETIKKESIDENLYVSLFGSPYLIVEKGFTVVPVPEKKALRVPTEVEKVYYKTILIRDRNLHDEIIRRKARSEFQKQISFMDYAEAEALMDKQISLLSKILKNSTEEVQYRKHLLARKMLIDAYIKRKNGKV